MWFKSIEISNQSQGLSFLHVKVPYSDNTAGRNSKTKCYKEPHLSACSGDLSTDAASIFMQGGRKFDIMDFLFYNEL